MKSTKYILSLLMLTTIPIHATSNETIRTWALAQAGVVLVAGGTIVLCRKSYSKFDKIFEVIGGAALIAAGIAGIVLSGEISHLIEKHYYR
ncbi:MAG: hypothetical protein AMXMBFR12_08470 [Candidatus Babeliales bacterium]